VCGRSVRGYAGWVLAKLLGIRREDRRDTAVGFATLVAILTAHAMLETARDALFLEKLPASYLPLAYIAIAALALVQSKLNQKASARFSRRKLLSLSLIGGAVITALFWQLSASGGSWVLGALYVWTGLLATVVVVQFWLQLGEVLQVDQAKRVFAIIGAGGLVGATLGSLIASGLLTLLADARMLLLVSAVFFAFAAVLPLGFGKAAVEKPTRRRGAAAPPAKNTLRMIKNDVYLRRLLWMVLIGAVLVTGVDYLFKATVATHVAKASLGSFFARYYAVVNSVALVVQLLLARRIVSKLHVNGALLVLPLLLLLGSIGFVLTLGLLPALLLKGGDGALRHSVHRTASEILYLPLQRQVRERFKGFAAAVGQRGGQALASLLILAATALSAQPRHLGYALVVLGIMWVGCLLGLKPYFLELFRKELRAGTLDTDVDIPELDLASFQLLVQSLSAEDDAEVLAALDMFESYGKTAMVPALILYHPAREVVLRAFEMFARSERQDVRRLVGRLLSHDDPEIRAAAVRSVSAIAPEEELLRKFCMNDDSPAVRCTALVGLVAAGMCADQEANRMLRNMASGRCGETRKALAKALRHLPVERFSWVAIELAAVQEPGLLVEVIRSMGSAPHESYIPKLIELLAERQHRAEARNALLATGEPAFEQLVEALNDNERPQRLRRHLPRSISRFGSHDAARVLQDALLHERDQSVVFKILRGLGRMRAIDPSLPIDREALLDLARQTLEQAVTTLHWRLTACRIVTCQQGARSPAAELLIAFLDEKEQVEIQHVFRLLHIIEPRQEFRIIYDGLRSADRKARASSLELLSHLVPSPLREGILAMVDDVTPRERQAQAKAFFDPPGRERVNEVIAQVEASSDEQQAQRALGLLYADTLREMLREPSKALRSLVAYHVAELGLEELRAQVIGASKSRSDVLRDIASSALDAFELAPTPELSGAS